jgi:hypothetical protein
VAGDLGWAIKLVHLRDPDAHPAEEHGFISDAGGYVIASKRTPLKIINPHCIRFWIIRHYGRKAMISLQLTLLTMYTMFQIQYGVLCDWIYSVGLRNYHLTGIYFVQELYICL